MMTPHLSGIHAAVVTPFTADLRVDYQRFSDIVAFLFGRGVDGLYVCGTTGEWFLLTMEERKQLAEAAVRASEGKGEVMVHVGAARTSDAVDLARHAESCGAGAISSLPPYVGRWTDAEAIEYYRAVATATALPFLMYHFPSLTGRCLSAATFRGLHAGAGVAGCKFTDMDLTLLDEIRTACGPDFIVLSGHDQILLPALVSGAAGAIGSFFGAIPDPFVAIYRQFQAGAVSAAAAAQSEVNQVIRSVKQYRLVPALKTLLTMQGIDGGAHRAPTLGLNPDEQSRLCRDLEALGFPVRR